jgi:hypothetical protein
MPYRIGSFDLETCAGFKAPDACEVSHSFSEAELRAELKHRAENPPYCNNGSLCISTTLGDRVYSDDDVQWMLASLKTPHPLLLQALIVPGRNVSDGEAHKWASSGRAFMLRGGFGCT